MELISLNCPQCKGVLRVDRDEGICYCDFCGSKLMLSHANRGVNNDNQEIIDNLLYRAYEFIDNHDYTRANEYLERVLDYEPNNREARECLKQLIIYPNVRVTRKSSVQSAARRFKIYVDNDLVTKISDGESVELIVPYGNHAIRMEGPGVVSTETEIMISSPSTLIDITSSIRFRWRSYIILDVEYL